MGNKFNRLGIKELTEAGKVNAARVKAPLNYALNKFDPLAHKQVYGYINKFSIKQRTKQIKKPNLP